MSIKSYLKHKRVDFFSDVLITERFAFYGRIQQYVDECFPLFDSDVVDTFNRIVVD